MTYFTNIFRQLRSLFDARHEPESLRPLAEIYWRALLSVAALCVVGILAYGVSEFVSVLDQLSSGGAAMSNPPTVLDRNQLESTLRAFDARTTISNPLPSAGVVDPSR
jgi:hypothetical protein